MAYNSNPYFLGNYSNPYMSMFNQQYPAQPQQQQTSSIIWINSEEEAYSYPVAPNNAVALWQSNKPIVYLKQTDASGKPTVEIYDLVKRQKEIPTVVNDADYVTKELFEGVVQKLNDTIADIRDELVIIKDDVYGIAGKKYRKDDADDKQ